MRLGLVGVMGRCLVGLVAIWPLQMQPLESEQQAERRSFVLTGEAARGYQVPADSELVQTHAFRRLGFVSERHEQRYEGIPVLGGQVTVLRSDGGRIVQVSGRHFPDIAPTNEIAIEASEAVATVARDFGLEGTRRSSAVLYLDPESFRYFWRVVARGTGETGDSVWEYWIDAETGDEMNRFDSLRRHTCVAARGEGRAYGRDQVLYGEDIKDLGCLVVQVEKNSPETRLVTETQRQITYDCVRDSGVAAIHSDATWDVNGRLSPGTGPLVDAHYYMALADSYFRTQYDYEFLTTIHVRGHAQGSETDCGSGIGNYGGAFWDPLEEWFGFGDGDGEFLDPFTSLDMVVHEFAHSVTQFTSELVYEGETGALEESFSDIMAAVVERLVDADALPAGVLPRREADQDLRRPGSEWWIGEDFDVMGNGLRNMQDPGEDGDPGHYSDLDTSWWDNGGVHTNNGIPNHAFYRLVEIHGVDIQSAADVFVVGFFGLSAVADFCEAMQATVGAAAVHDAVESSVVAEAWNDVGVDVEVCGG